MRFRMREQRKNCMKLVRGDARKLTRARPLSVCVVLRSGDHRGGSRICMCMKLSRNLGVSTSDVPLTENVYKLHQCGMIALTRQSRKWRRKTTMLSLIMASSPRGWGCQVGLVKTAPVVRESNVVKKIARLGISGPRRCRRHSMGR